MADAIDTLVDSIGALIVALIAVVIAGGSLCGTAPVTEPPPPEPLTFAVIGDYGLVSDGRASARVGEMIDSWNVDLILTTGDNNYFDGEARTIDRHIGRVYHEYIGNYQGTYGPGATENRFFPSLGNHDWHAAGAQPYLDYFTLQGNERYYDFVRGNVHFWALDSDANEPDGIAPHLVQAQWLKEGLAASTETFNVVYFHHPVWTSTWRDKRWMQNWSFKEWGVDLILTGHGHHYERVVKDGLNYTVNGLGGHTTIHPFWDVQVEGGPFPPIPGSVVQYNDDFGAQLVTATETEMLVQFITVGGVTVDSFTVLP